MRAVTGAGDLCVEARQIRTTRAENWILRAVVLRSVLKRLLDGDTDANSVCDWADALELVDHVTYDPTDQGPIADVLFNLSTPEINGPLTRDRAEKLLASLGDSGSTL